jgi:phage recombination protein Bet
MQESVAVAIAQPSGQSLISRMASRFGVEPNKMLGTLKATCFKGEVSNEQMMALLIVAEQHGLNPWTKEIYAFPDKNNGIVPVVGVDGWTRILNAHPQFNGMEFVDGPMQKDGLPEWIECVIYRRDREHPTRTREYMAECKRGTGPWGSHPRRMLRHKALIQCSRLAMSFAGIYDEDEAQRIIEGTVAANGGAIDDLNAEITGKTIDGAEPEQQAAKPKPKQPSPAQEEAPAVTYAELAEKINAAKTSDELDLVADLTRSLPDEAQRAECDVEIRAKRKALKSAQ